MVFTYDKYNPEKLGVKVQGIRDVKNKKFLAHFDVAPGNRARHSSAIKDDIREKGIVHNVILRNIKKTNSTYAPDLLLVVAIEFGAVKRSL